jgi:hypothetical protein
VVEAARSFVVCTGRAHVTALARLSQASTIPSSNQRFAPIFCPGSPARASLSQDGGGHLERLVSCKVMQGHARSCKT